MKPRAVFPRVFAICAIVVAFATQSGAAQPASQMFQKPGDRLPPAVHTPSEAGLTLPTLLQPIKARYTDEARKARFRGGCMVQLIVDAHGLPQNVRVTKPIGMGLEESAIEAVKRERFEPGRYLGHAVSVAMSMKVSFDPAQ